MNAVAAWLRPARAWVLRALAAARRRVSRTDLPVEHAPVASATHAVRPALVPASLADLRGSSEGTITLPPWLYWSREDHDFRLGDRDDVVDAYGHILANGKLADITELVNAHLLAGVWRDLAISRAQRAAWEQAHPELSQLQPPAAA